VVIDIKPEIRSTCCAADPGGSWGLATHAPVVRKRKP
jgi:hypothetical protein